MGVRKTIIVRIAIIYFLMFLLGVIVVVKIAAIQNIKTERWKQIAENLNNNTVITEANRGNIYADDYSVLATSVPGYYVRLDLAAPGVKQVYEQESDSLAYYLFSMFGNESKAKYKQKLDAAYRSGNRGFTITPRKVDYIELQKIKNFPILRRGQNRGGRIIETENKRILPLGSLAARTVGTLNKGAYGGVHGNIGYTGIEGAFEPYLKGEPGIGYKQNLSGRWVTRTEIEPRDGMDIITTLNIKLQDIVETALLGQLNKSQADWGTAILMEVKTGKIKAIANFGVADTDENTNNNIYTENYNYALGHAGCYEPGSTFKLMSLMVAMEQGLVDTSDVYDTGNGIWKYKDRTVYDSDWRYGGHGVMTVKQIFEKSSNVGVAKIITSCYEKKPKDYVDRLYDFGLNKPLNIEIIGEGIPFMKYPGEKDWWGTTLAWMSYGYEIKMTPLQVLTFYNAVANNGKMVKPSLIKEIRDGGIVVKNFKQEVLNPMIVSKETLGKAKKMLEGVCESGTGTNVSSKVFKIAGKTGTAQIAANGEYPKGLYLASFAGYFPADDPVYSMIVTVNSPRGGIYYGGSVAGPVFKEIAEKVYAREIGITKLAESDDTDNSQLPEIKNGRQEDILEVLNHLKLNTVQADVRSDYVEVKSGEGTVQVEGKEIPEGKVPDVMGMGASDAVFLLENAGLSVKVQGMGKVKKQSLLPGSGFRQGQLIYITLS
ncbi:MAG: transpeptidase family protein [Prolixibacteraceae bacterium]|nr:transpeptidase family protein [Prolixibacteraceae bacterium]MBN2773749.1 transpeptidase family protein [Prolixibacteraceae bacterium]